MTKKIWIIFFFLAVAPTLAGQGLAFAQLQDDGTPCPPECVTDSMEIVTWYPSPYNEYEELRLYPTQRDPGDCDDDKIGLMYYDHGGTKSDPADDKMRICKGISLGWEDVGEGFWQELSGSDISNTNSGKIIINTTDSNKVSLEASGAVRLGNYATVSLPNCNNTILGALVYDTTKKRPYVCALNASNNSVWKPLDSDSDEDGIISGVDSNDENPDDATATEADVVTGKTFYARGGSIRTGTAVMGGGCWRRHTNGWIYDCYAGGSARCPSLPSSDPDGCYCVSGTLSMTMNGNYSDGNVRFYTCS